MGNKGYMQTSVNRNIYSNHRLIYIYHNGDIPINLYIDHIDRNKLNNSIENLRIVTSQENQFNRDPKGYHLNKKTNKYVAQIQTNRRLKHIGCFDTPEEAREAYRDAKKKIHIIRERINNGISLQ